MIGHRFILLVLITITITITITDAFPTASTSAVETESFSTSISKQKYDNNKTNLKEKTSFHYEGMWIMMIIPLIFLIIMARNLFIGCCDRYTDLELVIVDLDSESECESDSEETDICINENNIKQYYQEVDISISDTVNCVVCVELLKSNGCKLPCGHQFHKKCIKPWIMKKMTCPICRKRCKRHKD